MWELLAIPFIAYIVCTSVFWTIGVILKRNQPNYVEAEELLSELASHIYCAISEDGADEVLCYGCRKSMWNAVEWLRKHDPDWPSPRHTISFDEALDDAAETE